jgi:hypothetical protein
VVLVLVFYQERSIDRIYTIVYLPLTFTLVGLVARFPSILWTPKIRIWTAYSLFTLANAAVPLVSCCTNWRTPCCMQTQQPWLDV